MTKIEKKSIRKTFLLRVIESVRNTSRQPFFFSLLFAAVLAALPYFCLLKKYIYIFTHLSLLNKYLGFIRSFSPFQPTMRYYYISAFAFLAASNSIL